MDHPQVATQEQWLAARSELLLREKEFTRARDALSAERRRLPMVPVTKRYVFEGPAGPAALADLFEGRRQLIVYHFMFHPAWDEGCNACSFLVDSVGHPAHLHARDTSIALVSRAPLAKIEAHRARMGWTIPWYSSLDNDFNYDFHVTSDEGGESPGLSVFLRTDNGVFHTYSTSARGLDLLLNTYNYLDLTPLGRLDPPGGVINFVYHDGQAPLPDHRRS